MPIVIDPVPGNVIAPSQTLTVRSDLFGPIPPNSDIQIDLFPVGSEQPCAGWAIPISNTVQPVKLSFEHHNRQAMFSAPPLNGAVTMKLEIHSAIGTFDQGTVTGLVYNPTGLLPELLRESVGTQQDGALSPLQAQQLEETHASTFPAISMDALLLEEITNGPQGGFAAAQLAFWIMGVIVRIASVPPEFRVNTADGDYWVRSLAVVRIYRGSDLWKRVPVHTSSKLIDFTEEGIVSAVAANLPLQWLLQISVQVSFAEGVTGQVFLMRNPL